MSNRKCRMCKREVYGRSDKLYCSLNCKNSYYAGLEKTTRKRTYVIDQILHRNRNILLRLLGVNKRSIYIHKFELIKRKFNFKYMTHLTTSKKGTTYCCIYEFVWIELENEEIYIQKQKSIY